MTIASTPQTISIGHGQHPEFSVVRLQTMAALPQGWAGAWTTIPEYLAAAEPFAPELVVVWQQSPDEYSAAEVLSLLARVPL
ncbi:MAG: hypothetical protein SFV23_15425, partial [Planctomycetaceae bacterium]|nr:hypothetical protein [Planctomycetaceae bacterium]